MNRIESVWIGRDNALLDAMFAFYAPAASRIVDVTCNKRVMWRDSNFSRKAVGYDRDPSVMPDVVAEWGALPDSDGSVDVLIYDPPHLPDAAASEKSMGDMIGRYGLGGGIKADNIGNIHARFLLEARRVLRRDGLIFAKIKDYVHNHRYQWNLELFNQAVRDAGMTPCDLIIKRDPAGGNLKSSLWKKAHHAKNVHCYWVVVRNSQKCEGREVPAHNTKEQS